MEGLNVKALDRSAAALRPSRLAGHGEQGRELGNAFKPSTWGAGLEVVPFEGAPEGGKGPNSSGISGQQVVDRIANEDGLARSSPQPLER